MRATVAERCFTLCPERYRGFGEIIFESGWNMTGIFISFILRSLPGRCRQPSQECRTALRKYSVTSKFLFDLRVEPEGKKSGWLFGTVARMDAGVRAYMDVFTACPEKSTRLL